VSAKPLTDMQQKFVAAYLADPNHNATQAAIAAGYSPRSGHVQAHQMLKRPRIRAAIKRALKPQLRKYGLTRERVIRETATLAFSDIMDFGVGEDGNVTLVGGAAKRATRALSSVKRKRRVTTRRAGDDEVTEVEHETEIKLWDKNRALETATKILGMVDDRPQITNVGPQVWLIGGRAITF